MLALAASGVVVILAAVVAPGERDVLVAVGGLALFAALLTYYLTPERLVPAVVSERIYAASALNQSTLAGDLERTDGHVYVPEDGSADHSTSLLLLAVGETVANGGRKPSSEGTTEHRGRLLRPTGATLFEPVSDAAPDAHGEPQRFAHWLANAVVEEFELADDADVEFHHRKGYLALGVTDSIYGPLDRFNHPITSFAATALVDAYGTSVTVDWEVADEKWNDVDSVVTLRWDSER